MLRTSMVFRGFLAVLRRRPTYVDRRSLIPRSLGGTYLMRHLRFLGVLNCDQLAGGRLLQDLYGTRIFHGAARCSWPRVERIFW